MIAKDWRRVTLTAGTLLALTLLGFFFIPGHTYLQSDTQIYIPIFERIENPNLYSRDILLNTAHIGLTIYDETAIGLQRLTNQNFELVLAVEQIAFRALGLWGVFLIATSCGLGDAAGLALAACYGLGATIVGPAVLSVEYEPVPRGFAVAFVLLGTGLLLHGRSTWACAAGSRLGSCITHRRPYLSGFSSCLLLFAKNVGVRCGPWGPPRSSWRRRLPRREATFVHNRF